MTTSGVYDACMAGYRGMGDDLKGTGRLLTYGAFGLLVVVCVLGGVVLPLWGLVVELLTAIF